MHAEETCRSGFSNRSHDAGAGTGLRRGGEWLQGVRPLRKRGQSRLSQFAANEYLDPLRLVLVFGCGSRGWSLVERSQPHEIRHADQMKLTTEILQFKFN